MTDALSHRKLGALEIQGTMKKFISFFAVMLSLGLSLDAATIEWANVGSTWATGANWVGGVAPADSTVTDIAAFGSQGAAAVNPNLTAQRSINGVSFLSGAYAYTIGGSILTIGISGISDSAANTETFSNGIRTSAAQTWTVNASSTLVLNGTVDLVSSGTTNRTLTVAGAGNTTFNGVITNSSGGSTGNLTYSGTGTLSLANTNTYTGNTIVSGAGATAKASKDGAFGLGNVSLTAGNITLTLANGATNNYIADSKSLSFVNTDTVNLNYIGTDTIAALIVDGVAMAPGIYGVGFSNPDSAFFGTGTITVVAIPEPASSALLGFGVLLGAAGLIRRRHS